MLLSSARIFQTTIVEFQFIVQKRGWISTTTHPKPTRPAPTQSTEYRPIFPFNSVHCLRMSLRCRSDSWLLGIPALATHCVPTRITAVIRWSIVILIIIIIIIIIAIPIITSIPALDPAGHLQHGPSPLFEYFSSRFAPQMLHRIIVIVRHPATGMFGAAHPTPACA